MAKSHEKWSGSIMEREFFGKIEKNTRLRAVCELYVTNKKRTTSEVALFPCKSGPRGS